MGKSFNELHLGDFIKANESPTAVYSKIKDALEKKELDPTTFSLRRAFKQTVGDPDELLCSQGKGLILESASAVTSTMFPIITAEVLAQTMIDTYDLDIKPVESLVTTMTTTRRDTRLAGFTALEGMKEVGEGMPYDASGFGEKYVMIDSTKYGRIIPITEEAIREDQTGMLLDHARKFGQMAAYKKAEVILKGVIDYSTNVYRPSGTATALYASGFSNLNASAGTINDSNLNTVIAAMRAITDENGNYVNVLTSEKPVLMYHPNVAATVETLLASKNKPGAGNNDVNIHYGKYTPFINPYISASTTWFLGYFNKQFKWVEHYPIQVQFAKPGNDYEFNRDITFAIKVRQMGGIGATDYRFVQKQTA